MSNISQFLSSTAIARPASQHGPGSNGYWRRQIYTQPGTYTWTAAKRGRIKIQAGGAASGGNGGACGASGCFGTKEFSVNAGDTLTLILGAGGVGINNDVAYSPAGGSSSISGSAIVGGPLVLPGAAGVRVTSFDGGTAAAATGPWDFTATGAVPAATGRGSPSSGSPFGNGKASTGPGGAGWGGGSTGPGGSSTHRANSSSAGSGGIRSKGGAITGDLRGETMEFWDLADCDSSGGAQGQASNIAGGEGGVGSGGGYAGSSALGGVSPLGGGTGVSQTSGVPKSGNSAGGGAYGGGTAGAGGDAFVFLFWDEVL